ncbi:hypothetical protein Krac_9800 [Ktedonobacter racemifer DSM 44963]|uniref:Uncharacterized protein n=1 Tax=Ktedonobacter racemifer DSM 44963 TaxID=485913 RepID=D6TDL1_KTERA|nr:hypothetical protein Krac_9800 [Ktedonobacter racemifer DSM 44963]
MSGGVEDALLLHFCNEAWTRRNRLPKDVGSYERRWGESATGVDLWLLLLCY